MPVCAIYARVSDELQVKGESVMHQVSFMREYVRRKAQNDRQEWLTPDEFIYCDEGITGTSMMKRPAVRSLLLQARTKKFSVVLFKGISRFARDTVDALIMLRTLQAYGLRVVSFEENYDSEKDSAELIFTMHSAVAQYESEKIGIRVRVGNFEKARAGKWSGRVPDGYLLNPETKQLIINPDRVNAIRKIFEYAVAIKSEYRIAQRLNEEGWKTARGDPWTSLKIRRIITNPVYTGDVYYGRRSKKVLPPDPEDPLLRRHRVVWNEDESSVALCENAHPMIIDRQVYLRVQKWLKTVHQPGRIGATHLLTGILFCSCGERMSIKHSGSGILYYRCTARQSKKSMCEQAALRASDTEHEVRIALIRDLDQRIKYSGGTDHSFAHSCHLYCEISEDLITPASIPRLIKRIQVMNHELPYQLMIEYTWC